MEPVANFDWGNAIGVLGWILVAIVLFSNASGGLSKLWSAINKNAHEAKTLAEEKTEKLQKTIEASRQEHVKYEQWFQVDAFDIKMLKRELDRLSETDIELLDGMHIIMQILLPQDDDGKITEWMRNVAKNESRSKIGYNRLDFEHFDFSKLRDK